LIYKRAVVSKCGGHYFLQPWRADPEMDKNNRNETTMHESNQTGFVKLSWLAGAAALAALGALAYFLIWPQYLNHQVQSQISDVLASVEACRADVEKTVRTSTAPVLSTSLFVCDGGASVGVKISPHLKSILMGEAGSMTVTLDYRSMSVLAPATNVLTLFPLSGDATVLRPSDVGKNITGWRCGSPLDGNTVPSQYLPARCKG
jgi:type IV pilus assembly protein PilA